MRVPRLRRLLLAPLGALALLPLAWVLIVTCAPTDCARKQIVARLGAATGRTVRLHSVRFAWCGSVHLEDLEIAAPEAGDDPWLKVADARIGVNCLQLLTGHIEPSEICVEGVTLRVLRRQDGSLELGDMLRKPSDPIPAAAEANSAVTEFAGLDVFVNDARITVIDEPTRTRLEFEGVEGHGTWAGPRVAIEQIQGALNGGRFELAAQLDRSGPAPAFEGQIRAHEVALNEGMTALGYLNPVLAGTPDGRLEGKITAGVVLSGHGETLDALRKTLVGHGTIRLDPIQIDGSELLAALSHTADFATPGAGRGRVGAVSGEFVIKDGRVATDDLTLNVGKVPIVLSGWTDFDGALDYRLKTDGLAEKLPVNARNLLSELDIHIKDLAALRVKGGVDALSVTLDGVPLNEDNPGGRTAGTHPKADDRLRFHEIGRKLRDKLLR